MHNGYVLHTIEFRDFVWIQLNFPKLKTTSGSVNISTLITLNTSVFS